MTTLVEMGISNAVQVTALAVVVYLLTRPVRNPAISRCLWLLVLLKLVTPPVLSIPLFCLPPSWNASDDVRRPAVTDTTTATPSGVPLGFRELAADSHPQSAAHARPTGVPAATKGAAARKHAAETIAFAETERRQSASGAPRSEDHRRRDVLVRIVGGYSQTDSDRLFGRALLIVGCCWIAGSLLWFATVIYRGGKFGRLLRRARRAPQQIQLAARQLADQLGICRAPEVLMVDANVSPFLWGAGNRAVIVLPRMLIDELSESQQSLILAHELTHLARQALRLRWLEIVAIGLYWWHPIAWIARRELRNAEELCCDAAVISVFSFSTGEYARTLLRTACFLADRRPSLPQTASGFGEPTSLKRRIKMIVKSQLRHRLSLRMRVGVLLLASVVLPLSPFTFGEDNDSPQGAVDGFDRFAEGQLADEDVADQETNSRTEKPIVNDDLLSASDYASEVIFAVSRPEPLFKSPGQLIINSGFEDSKSIGVGVPGNFGGWGGDQTSVVGREQGIRPQTGDRMLRLLGSGPQGSSKGSTTCEVFQIVDLSKYREFLDAGNVNLTASLVVNRVHQSEQTDTAFSFKVYVCDGSPLHFHHKFLSGDTLGEAGSYIHADKNPETWESIKFTMRLPRGATYLGMCVAAGENVSNDASDEFHGHYVDEVSVKIRPRTSSVLNLSPDVFNFRLNAGFRYLLSEPDPKQP